MHIEERAERLDPLEGSHNFLLETPRLVRPDGGVIN